MYGTVQAAKQIGVSKNTLLRWIGEALIADVGRDWRGWRVWSDADIERARAFRQAYHEGPIPRAKRRPASKHDYGKAAADSMWRSAQAWAQRARALP